MGESENCRQYGKSLSTVGHHEQFSLSIMDQLVFFIWRNLDSFMAMQKYLMDIEAIDRPTFKEVTGTKCKEAYPSAYGADINDTLTAMGHVKAKTAGVVTTGLWPLDHESNYDWRHTTHKRTVWTQWVYMARIETVLVGRYRKKMLSHCDAAAAMRKNLEELLSPLCNPTIVVGSNANSGDITAERKFYWPDKIAVPAPSQVAASASSLNVDKLKADEARQHDTTALIADIAGVFKKLHSTKAGLAIRGRPGFFRPIVEKLNELEQVRSLHHLYTLIY
jgi:hypothetical protein